MSIGARVEQVVRGVVAAAVRAAGADGVVVLEDWTAEGELLYEWLVRELGEARVWRVASLASNVQGVPGTMEAQLVAAWRASREGRALLAHPVNRTALLLGGPPPRADLLPFGDVPASQLEALTGGWTASPEIEQVAAAAGGVQALDRALGRWIDERWTVENALADVDPAVARRIVELYERGRYYRLRPLVVPKLGARTIGIDLFD
ncbi:MAG TPA: hypothetical protein VMN60_01360 [Longimicrobiales bacterium]|nr:hypothetical protein [Longimicrobiales bacterium]